VGSTPAKSNAQYAPPFCRSRFETKLGPLLLILGTGNQRAGAPRGQPTNEARAMRMAAKKMAADETAAVHPPSLAQVRICFFI
jgi:hypothetical protein